MSPDDEFSGYRYEDLREKRIVSSRTDMQRKQKEHGFPMPVRLGTRQAWFVKSEIHDWLAKQIAKRDEAIQNANPPALDQQDIKRLAAPRPAGLPKLPKALKAPKRPAGRS